MIVASAKALAVAGPAVAKYIPEIIAVLETTTSAQVRHALILALGEAGKDAKPALPKLFALLKDPSPSIRRLAMRSLIKAGDADPAEANRLAKAYLTASDPELRRLASIVTPALGISVDDVARRLRNPDVNVALGAVPIVPRLGDRASAVIPDLVALIARLPPNRANSAKPMEEITNTLARLGPKAVPGILAGFDSPHEPVRQACRDALAGVRLDAVEAIPVLRKGLSHTNMQTRRECAMALAHLGYRAREAIPDLVKAMAAHEDTARAAGIALAWIGGAAGDDAKAIVDMARKPGPPEARWGRITALGAIGKDAVPVLDEIARGLTRNDLLPQSGLQEARRLIDRTKVVDSQLPLMLKERYPQVPAFVALQIEMSPEQQALFVTNTTKRLADSEPSIQVELLRCLGWLGRDASSALPAIEMFLTAPDEAVRRAATRAVNDIRP